MPDEDLGNEVPLDELLAQHDEQEEPPEDLAAALARFMWGRRREHQTKLKPWEEITQAGRDQEETIAQAVIDDFLPLAGIGPVAQTPPVEEPVIGAYGGVDFDTGQPKAQIALGGRLVDLDPEDARAFAAGIFEVAERADLEAVLYRHAVDTLGSNETAQQVVLDLRRRRIAMQAPEFTPDEGADE